MTDVLPMFPLGTVLVPGMVLPLHVFEARYRALVRDLGVGGRFGVVLIERGREVGGGDQRTIVGTTAEIVRADELDDGRWLLVVVGDERIRVEAWLPDDPYPRARVTPWPDPPVEVPHEVRQRATDALGRVRALARDLGEELPGDADLADDVTTASYQATVLGPLGPLDRHRLLCREDARDRLDLLVQLLGDQEEVLRFRLDATT